MICNCHVVPILLQVGKVIFKDMTPFVAYQTLTDLRKEESFQFGKTKVCPFKSALCLKLPYGKIITTLLGELSKFSFCII